MVVAAAGRATHRVAPTPKRCPNPALGWRRVIAIEGGRLDRVREARLYSGRLPPDGFALFDEDAGAWVARGGDAPRPRAGPVAGRSSP